MARVRDWIDDFLARHRARFGPHDWPVAGTEEYREFSRTWITAFATAEVTQPEADAASYRLGANPPRWRSDHIPRVLAEIKSIREERGAPAETREEVERQSRGCEYCSGFGLVPVYYTDLDFAARNRIPASVAAHCTCPSGRWMRRKLGESDSGRALIRRIPDLNDVIEGRSVWLIDSSDTPVGLRREIRMVPSESSDRPSIYVPDEGRTDWSTF